MLNFILWDFHIKKKLYEILVGNASVTSSEDECWKGVPSKLLSVGDKSAIFFMFMSDSCLWESIMTVSEFNELDHDVGGREK